MIDPVRFIGNFSSGKMGYSIANELAQNGALVVLISGPTSLTINHTNIQLINVISAEEMYETCIKNFTHEFDGAILSAAVSDFTPSKKNLEKIKKTSGNINLELKPTKDIALELSKIKKPDQVLIGFALETENEMENAIKKMKRKNFDFIVLNSLKDKGAGFNHDTNKITVIDNKNNILKFNLKSKQEVARDIVNKLVDII